MEIRKNYFDFYTPEEWKIIFEDQEKSGLSVANYCKKKSLPRGTFYGWRSKLDPSSCSNLKEIRDKWKGLIEDWEKSGLSRLEYCKKKELSAEVLSLWEKKFNPPPSRKTAFEKWTEIIEDWKKSGLKEAVYCRKKKLSSSSFYGWKKKINSQKPLQLSSDFIEEPEAKSEILQEAFMPLGLDSPFSRNPSSPNSKIEVTLPQGHRLYLEGIDWEILNPWLTLLRSEKNK